MAYRLTSGGTAAKYVTIPTCSLAGDFDITLVATQAGQTNGTFLFAGTGVAGQNGLDLYRNLSGKYQIFIDNAAVIAGTINASNNLAAPDTIRINRVSGVVTLRVNGVVDGTTNNSNTLRIDRFFHRIAWAHYGNMAFYTMSITAASGNRFYDASASGGAGTSLPDTTGSQNGTLVGFSVPADWVFYSSGATYTGGGTCGFLLDISGGGTATRIGGGTCGFTLDISGGGTATRIGGAVVNFTLTTAGSGIANRIGGGSFTFTLDTVGGGTITRIGGGGANILFNMYGGGDVIPASEDITGGAVLPILFGVSGGGVVIRNAGAVMSFTVNANGSGITNRVGGGPVTINTDISGMGFVVRHSGGECTVHFDMTGGGNVQSPGYKPSVKSPVVVVSKTVRVPYAIIVQKSFRGAVCKL